MTAAMTNSVRVSVLSDAEAVSTVLAASYSTLLTSHYEKTLLDRALPFMTKANPKLLACGTYYVAQSLHGGIIGCGGWAPEHPETGDVLKEEAHIRHFATHPDWIRMGVAQSLMKRCCIDSKAQGIGKLLCYSTLAAESFYRACGFETIALLDVLMGAKVPFKTVMMQRELR
jgi:N-acetylglutamate synthase-like GNAT family acetyltransferase